MDVKENRLSIMGNRLKELRDKRGFTQKQTCEKIGCTEPSYRAWEHGDRVPDTISVIALADLYGVSCDYILGVSNYTNIGNKEISEITGLSEKGVDSLRRLNKKSQYGYDCLEEVNKETISFINRVLEEEETMKKYRTTVFRLMEQYVCSQGSEGTISEEDETTKSVKQATGTVILFKDSNMPTIFDISSLKREALFSQIRKQLEYYREKEERNNGRHLKIANDKKR